MDPSVVKNMVSRPDGNFESELKCRACNGDMEEGNFPAAAYTFGLFWQEGKFVKSFFGYFASRKRRHLRITPYRCVNCGRLEQYAND